MEEWLSSKVKLPAVIAGNFDSEKWSINHKGVSGMKEGVRWVA